MKVTFNWTKKDMWKQMWWLQWNRPMYRNMHVVMCLIFVGFLAKDVVDSTNMLASITSIVILILQYIVIQGTLLLLLLVINLYTMSKAHGLICKHSIEISEEGIREQTEVNNSFHLWKTIDMIKVNKKYIYYFGRGAGGLGIPKNAFTTAMEAEQFSNEFLLHWKNNRDM